MAKYDIIKTNKLRFARFGGLSSVNQEGYSSRERNFHTPPATRGFYAFVWPYIEPFLLGGNWTCWPWVIGSKFTYVRDENGVVISDKHPDRDKYSNSNKIFSIPTKAWNENCEKRGPRWGDEDYDKYTEAQVDEMTKAAELDWETNHKDEARWLYAKKPSPKIFTYKGTLWHHLERGLKPHQVLARKGSWVKSSMEDYRQALEKEMHSFRKQMQSDPWRGVILPNKSPFFCSGKDHLEVFIEKL